MQRCKYTCLGQEVGELRGGPALGHEDTEWRHLPVQAAVQESNEQGRAAFDQRLVRVSAAGVNIVSQNLTAYAPPLHT